MQTRRRQSTPCGPTAAWIVAELAVECMTRCAATRIGLRSRRVQLQLTESNWIANQAPAEPTVDICNSISRNNKFGLVEEYIAEFEGARKDYE